MLGASAFEALTGRPWGPSAFRQLQPVPAEREEGWQQWLADQGILDYRLSEEESYLRYQKFRPMTFPLLPPARWY